MRATSFWALTFVLIAITLGAKPIRRRERPFTSHRTETTRTPARGPAAGDAGGGAGPGAIRKSQPQRPDHGRRARRHLLSAGDTRVYAGRFRLGNRTHRVPRRGRRNARHQRRGQAGVELAAAPGRRLDGQDARRPGHRPALRQRRAAADGPVSQLRPGRAALQRIRRRRLQPAARGPLVRSRPAATSTPCTGRTGAATTTGSPASSPTTP